MNATPVRLSIVTTQSPHSLYCMCYVYTLHLSEFEKLFSVFNFQQGSANKRVGEEMGGGGGGGEVPAFPLKVAPAQPC